MTDLLIKDAWIYDGSGGPPYRGDIGVLGERIAFITESSNVNAQRVVHANELVASPGFMDVHSHSEFSLIAHPEAESKLLQGITTEINGNCGFSAAPIYHDAVRQKEKEFKKYGIKDRWNAFHEYFDVLSRSKLAINFATLVGHGNIRASVIGYDNIQPEESNIEDMVFLLKESIKDGAIGLSTGLICAPGVYSHDDEIVMLISRSGIKNLIYTSHIRSEGDRLIESLDELLGISERTGIRVHISHLKTSGRKNWHKIDKVISMINEKNSEEIKVTCDRYPYTASLTSLDSVLPSWIYEGGDKAEINKLNNRKIVSRMKKEMMITMGNDDYWKHVTISSVGSKKNQSIEGRKVNEIAHEKGVSPIDLVTDLLIEENLCVDAIFFSMNEDNMRRILSLRGCMIGSDSPARTLAEAGGIPHPRAFGTFPRFIGKYILGEGLMPLREAIYRITCLPAKTFGIKDRGILKEGAYADIILFDKEEIMDTSTFEKPLSAPKGFESIIVNGAVSFENGRLTGESAGKIL